MFLRAGTQIDKRRFDKSVFVRDVLDIWFKLLELLALAQGEDEAELCIALNMVLTCMGRSPIVAEDIDQE